MRLKRVNTKAGATKARASAAAIDALVAAVVPAGPATGAVESATPDGETAAEAAVVVAVVGLDDAGGVPAPEAVVVDVFPEAAGVAAGPEAAPEAVVPVREVELEVVFASRLVGQTVRIRDNLRDRHEEDWAALIATSAWVQASEPGRAEAGPAPESGINPYRATTKARRISNCDIESLCALPAVVADDDRLSQVALVASPVQGSVRMPGPLRSEVVATMSVTIMPASGQASEPEAADETEVATTFDRWAEGEGAWHQDQDADGEPTDQAPASDALALVLETADDAVESCAAMFASELIAAVSLELNPPAEPHCSVADLVSAAAAVSLELNPLAELAEPVDPPPASVSPVVSTPAPMPPVEPPPASVSPVVSTAAPMPPVESPPAPVPPVVSTPAPSPAEPPVLLPGGVQESPQAPVVVPEMVAVPSQVALPPLPAGFRQVRTLLFDDGPLFSAHPLLVTVIIEPLPRSGESPPPQVALSVEPPPPPAPPPAPNPPMPPTPAPKPVPLASAKPKLAEPSRVTPVAPVSLVGGVVAFGASIGRALGLGAPPRGLVAGVQKKSAVAHGGGGKVRPSGVQGRPGR